LLDVLLEHIKDRLDQRLPVRAAPQLEMLVDRVHRAVQRGLMGDPIVHGME
jgi:hypothetical protein